MGGLASALPARRASAVPGGGRACFVACLPCHCGARGGACPLCRLLTLPLDFFSAPIPPPPFPGGEGGDFLFSYARGFAPCIPGAEPARHWLALPLWKTQWGGLAPALPARRASAVPGGGAQGGQSPTNPAFSFAFAPIPPAPFPGGEGGDFLFSYARGCAPCIPGAEPGRHWLSLPRGRGPSQTPPSR